MTLARSGLALRYEWQPDAAAVRTDKRYHKKGFITVAERPQEARHKPELGR